MLPYSSPDRPLALSILESHAQQQADIDGRSLTDFVAEQAAVGVRALDAMLSNPVGGDVERYRAARDRLAADPAYVFEYRQDQVDASFGQQLETLRAGLSRSHRALGLVDPTKLKVLLQDGSPGTVNVTPDLIVAALQRVQVVAPLSGGIEAYSSSEDRTPTVLVHYGVSNLMLYASHLIVAYGMHETSPGISNPRNLREHPEEYARAVSELESLIRQCESGSPSDEPVTQAAAHYRRLVDAVAAHALSFFVFHELGHLLIADTRRSEEELACDEFAASILGASDDDRAWLGAAMSAQLLSIVLRTSHTEWRSAEYPGASYRFARFADALQFAGARLVPPVDDLLAIPTRMYEQEAFETDTRRLLFFSYAATLLARWGEQVEPATVLQAALAVIDYATRLPPVMEHPQLTCWNDESGQRAYVLTLEPYRALQVAGWMLAGRAPQWERLAAEAALLLITSVNHDPPPTEDAAGVFRALAGHARGARRDRRSLEYLRGIGAIDQTPTWFPRSTSTSIFYHQQAPGDGDLPLSGGAFARRQLGAVMSAWHAYVSRKDRETPWHVQRDVKIVDGWP